jgi:uncharacterized protein
MIHRQLQARAEELLDEFRILYLTGPRQSGKTTMARAIAQNRQMLYVTLEDQAMRTAINSDPHGFIRSQTNKRLVIDEFQYAPDLLPAIKEASDLLPPETKGKFLLTGSTDIFRSAKVQESLPGHMARLELLPLSCGELGGNPLNILDFICKADFSYKIVPFVGREQLARRILLGGYPEVQDKSDRSRPAWFRSYIEGRLFKDFETLYAARGDYHSRLHALVPALAGLSGNLLKYASLANDLELNDKVIKSYIEILELMFIMRRVPAYIRNRAKRHVTRMPKIHFIDTGLASHLLGLRTAEVLLKSQFYGGLLESMIYTECLKHVGWAEEDLSIMHFRDTQQHEVDIVLERMDGGIIGMEIKASASFRLEDFRGLAALADYAGSQFQHGVLIYTGDKILPVKYHHQVFYALPIGLINGEF